MSWKLLFGKGKERCSYLAKRPKRKYKELWIKQTNRGTKIFSNGFAKATQPLDKAILQEKPD